MIKMLFNFKRIKRNKGGHLKKFSAKETQLVLNKYHVKEMDLNFWQFTFFLTIVMLHPALVIKANV